MNQKIRLTWKTDESGDEPIVEECELVHEDASIFTADGLLIENGMEMLIQDGRVIFEDAQGIFGLRPKQVIKIEKL